MTRFAWFCAVVIFALSSSPAWSHSQVISSNPEDGEVVSALPEMVELEFNEELREPAFVAVVAPDGTSLETQTRIDGNRAIASVAPSPLTGQFAMNYRVVSADGHPISGSVSFVVETKSDTASPDPASANQGGKSNQDSPGGSSMFGLGIGLVALVVVVVVGLAVWWWLN